MIGKSMDEKRMLVDYGTQWSSFCMVVLGGQITLASAFFREGPGGVELLMAALFLMLVASIAARAMAENVVRTLLDVEQLEPRWLRTVMRTGFAPTQQRMLTFSVVAALSASLSLLAIMGFVGQRLAWFI